MLFALANEFVPGLPAYTVPAIPLPLKTDPGAVIVFPGTAVIPGLPHVVPGAPGWPGPFGLMSAYTAPIAITIRESIAITNIFLFIILPPFYLQIHSLLIYTKFFIYISIKYVLLYASPPQK
jgi:hypothetical protein